MAKLVIKPHRDHLWGKKYLFFNTSLSFFGLKCCTNSLTRCTSIRRTYINVLCRAVALAVVIYAIFNCTIYALDVLLITSASLGFVHFDIRPFDVLRSPSAKAESGSYLSSAYADNSIIPSCHYIITFF